MTMYVQFIMFLQNKKMLIDIPWQDFKRNNLREHNKRIIYIINV